MELIKVITVKSEGIVTRTKLIVCKYLFAM